MLARYEENAHLLAILKHFGREASLFELKVSIMSMSFRRLAC